MSKLGIVALLAILFISGTAFGQSLLDSVFGPSGLGVWGAPPAGQQFDDPRYYGGYMSTDPNQPMGQQTPSGYPQGYAQQYPQDAYGYGQPQYAPQQPYYPQAPGGPAAAVPSPQYGAAPTQPAPQAPPVARPPSPRSGAQGQAQRTSRQRPVTGPQETGGKFGDPLPPGAVRITTTTPEGTIVQYYPPAGTEGSEQAYQRPRPRAASSRAPRSDQQGTQRPPSETSGSSIAMPKPVPIPQGQDPRAGWTPNLQ